MKYAIFIGTPEESVIAAGKAILSIMGAEGSDTVKASAIRCLAHIVNNPNPANATVTGCTINVGPKRKKRERARHVR